MRLRKVRAFGAAWVLALAALAGCASDGGGGGGSPAVTLQVPAKSSSALTLEGPDGASLHVPAGASATDVTIGMAKRPRAAPAGTKAVATSIELTPAGTTFDLTLELTIPIEPSSLPPGKTIDDVVVVRASHGSDVFVPIPTRRNGAAVVAQTEHFSDFLAVVFDGPSPFGECADHMCVGGETCDTCPYDCGSCAPVVDDSAPRLVSIDPADGTTGFRGDLPITVHFDEMLGNAAYTDPTGVFVTDPSGADVAGTRSGVNEVIFWSTVPWSPSTTYTIHVGSISDLASNVFAGGITSTFTTGPAHTFVSSVPADGAIDVDWFTSVVLTFSGPVEPNSFVMTAMDTVCGGTVLLRVKGDTSCVPGTLSYSASNDVVTIAPLSPLGVSLDYELVLTPFATDENGFSLATTIGFHTTAGQ